MQQILIADDNTDLRRLVRNQLAAAGFDTIEASDGQQAVTLAEQYDVVLVILDIMMPKLDGVAACAAIKRAKDLPVIMLTAKSDIFDKQKGFAAGCDDYLTKPFDERELLFRVQALLRRYHNLLANVIEIGKIRLSRQQYSLEVAGEELYLPLKEFELLYQLAARPQQIFPRETLIQHIWGTDYDGSDRTVDVHIKRLRSHLPANSGIEIKTMRGVGYSLEVTV
ncbi:response regulator transcription factor [Loigolactobacillus backii]|uniref:Heme response regulator HssR n=2 Tax=Loigolactobacillus backii TaxID=375175 RepID=A0A192H570_9LACO|nr:response regulator transcription factor [Loigolactobacillus backii]ANK60393.1 DNA-binding response regulator [Loigolactobacillus backii]ANK63530.1 DNA-binding response regulator [Loigolactobacillus backii]ANK65920.1 DNA-binding response regulator [Loigolactobacillus backii]ANK68391.1 DNA-binding response regulator [Loigolactobacillus backii]ANK70976.1 DNA-binding response regulator [Loigolactobacillus backii]